MARATLLRSDGTARIIAVGSSVVAQDLSQGLPARVGGSIAGIRE